MDPDLQQALTQLEARLASRIDRVGARLETPVDAMETRLTRLETHIDAVETRLRAHIEERIETTETKLMTVFHNWAQTVEVRGAWRISSGSRI